MYIVGTYVYYSTNTTTESTDTVKIYNRHTRPFQVKFSQNIIILKLDYNDSTASIFIIIIIVIVLLHIVLFVTI